MTHQTIDQFEDEGIRVLKSAFKNLGFENIEIQATPQSFRYDAQISDHVICEIKGRRLHPDDYPTYFLEEKKYQALQEILEQDDNDFQAALYVSYFRKSNVAIAWRLTDKLIQSCNTQTVFAPTSTASDITQPKERIRKRMILLPAKRGTCLRYDRSLLN